MKNEKIMGPFEMIGLLDELIQDPMNKLRYLAASLRNITADEDERLQGGLDLLMMGTLDELIARYDEVYETINKACDEAQAAS